MTTNNVCCFYIFWFQRFACCFGLPPIALRSLTQLKALTKWQQKNSKQSFRIHVIKIVNRTS